MSRFSNLADKPNIRASEALVHKPAGEGTPNLAKAPKENTLPPSRVGRKAIAAYFSPVMSIAMHICARKQGLSLQELMAEAFDDVLRKYGESPIGD